MNVIYMLNLTQVHESTSALLMQFLACFIDSEHENFVPKSNKI